MTDYYLPIGSRFEGEIVVKRSRFLTTIARVNSPTEARHAISSERARFPDARHHCHAFAITSEGALPSLHSSDDGEPAGTAGRPILDTLRNVPLVNVVAIVTRYFGGTLLGTGGLVRAYSEAVRSTYEGAPVARRRQTPQYVAHLPHSEAGKYIAEWNARGWDVRVEYLPKEVIAHIITDDDAPDLLASMSSGALTWELGEPIAHEQVCGIIHDGKVET